MSRPWPDAHQIPLAGASYLLVSAISTVREKMTGSLAEFPVQVVPKHSQYDLKMARRARMSWAVPYSQVRSGQVYPAGSLATDAGWPTCRSNLGTPSRSAHGPDHSACRPLKVRVAWLLAATRVCACS